MNNELNPILELYRGKVYSNILRFFINTCLIILNKNIFSVKKTYSRTLTNLLSSWLFTLYSNYDFSDDPFLPSNYEDVTYLKNTLLDFCKYDESIENKENKIDIITKKLINLYSISLLQISNYSECEYYDKNKKKYKITKKLIKQQRNGDLIDFYKFNIKLPFKIIYNNRLINILDNIIIPIMVYNKCKNNYSGEKSKMDEYIWIILFRYQLLGSNNHQLGVLPKILNQMKEDFNLSFECFSSTINSSFDSYCSVYSDVEKYFGSKGSFFNINIKKGTCSFNPPYQKDIIDRGIKKLFKFLEKSKEELNFIITIPIWDEDGKEIISEIFDIKTKSDIDYEEFKVIKDIKKSKYFRGLRMIPKDNFTYLDHNFHLYKNITIQNTYIIVLSNKDNKFIDKINQYNFS